MSDRKTLAALAARIEAAAGPDRYLDAEIVVAMTPCISGVERPPLDGLIDNPTAGWLFLWDKPLSWSERWRPVPLYTASLDAAVTLVPEGYWWEVGRDCGDTSPLRHFGARGGRCFRAACGKWGSHERPAWGATPALALCAAALRARMEEMGDA